MVNSLWERIAYSNPSGANDLLVDYGIKPGLSHKDIAYKLALLVDQNGEHILEQLKEIHPDKDLFDQNNTPAQNMQMGVDGFNNCEGCGGKCGGKKPASYGVDGTSDNASTVMHTQSILQSNHMTLAIMGIFAFSALALAMVVIKKN